MDACAELPSVSRVGVLSSGAFDCRLLMIERPRGIVLPQVFGRLVETSRAHPTRVCGSLQVVSLACVIAPDSARSSTRKARRATGRGSASAPRPRQVAVPERGRNRGGDRPGSRPCQAERGVPAAVAPRYVRLLRESDWRQTSDLLPQRSADHRTQPSLQLLRVTGLRWNSQKGGGSRPGTPGRRIRLARRERLANATGRRARPPRGAATCAGGTGRNRSASTGCR